MVVIMLGAPGVGKGTVAGILTEKLGIPQVSSGDIFRKAMTEKTELGLKVQDYMSKGELVPDELTIKVIEERLKEPDLANGVILDGFPRTEVQAEKLDEFLKEQNKKIDIVLDLTSPEDEILDRIVNRRICSNQECKTVYNIKLNRPKVDGICDKCGANLYQREDDTVEKVKNRIKVYEEQTKPLEKYYEGTGALYKMEISQKINRMAKEAAEEIVEYLKRG